MERLLTIKEVADYLQVCPSTIRTWLEMGYLNCIKLGVRDNPRSVNERHHIRIAESQLSEFLIKGRTDKVNKIEMEQSESMEGRYKEKYFGDELKISTKGAKVK